MPSACFVAIVVSLVLGCARSGLAETVAEPQLTPANATVVREVQAGGAQVYTCRATPTGTFQWMLLGPKAILINDDGSDFGTHAAGPTWTALDGSSIGADGAHPIAKVDRPGSVPALLLSVTTSQGEGALAGVRFVRRAETGGGAAPATGCDADHENAVTAVHYSAVYTFFR